MKKHTPFLLFLAGLLIASCSHPNKGIQIYNPLGWAMDVTINDKLYVVGGDDALDLPPQSGTYNIHAVYQDEVLLDTVIELSSSQVNKGVLLNFSGEPLYRYGQDYEDAMTASMRAGQPSLQQQLAFLDSISGNPGKERNIPIPGIEDMVVMVIDSNFLLGDFKEYPGTQVVIQKDWDIEPQYAFPEEMEIKVKSTERYKSHKFYKLFSKSRMLEYYFEE